MVLWGLIWFFWGLTGFYRDDNGQNTGILMDIPSGYVKIAIEHDHRNSGFSH